MVIAAIMGLACAAAVNAAVEARTANFQVVTELEAVIAQSAAAHLESVRARYKALGLTPDSSHPLQVMVFRDMAELEAAAQRLGPHPKFARGFFRPGADRDFIGLAWDASGPPEVALAHEYAHRIFARSQDPLWFREGIAEYLARAEVREEVTYIGVAAPGFVRSLETEPWIPLAHLMNDFRNSGLLGHPNFYAQCWLLVHWMASSRGNVSSLRPSDLNERVDKLGMEAVEQHLREYVRQPLPALPVPDLSWADAAVRIRELDEWEMPYWLADLLREMQLWVPARSALRDLEARFPGPAEPSESLGSLEMDTGNYDEAERDLASAVAKGSLNPRIHYRYSLMLMRPAPAAGPERAHRAVEQAQKARQGDSTELLYVLTEAQARTVAEEWSEAARLLAELAANPVWRDRAEAEFAELQRRHQQQLKQSHPPVLAEAPEIAPRFRFLDPAFEPVPKPPAAASSRETQASAPRDAWPPPGTVLFHGRIAGVECQAGERIVIVDSGRLRVRLREKAGAPPELHHPPLKWRKLPCETRGWVVNVVYRPTAKDPKINGEVVAVLF